VRAVEDLGQDLTLLAQVAHVRLATTVLLRHYVLAVLVVLAITLLEPVLQQRITPMVRVQVVAVVATE